MDFTGLFTGKQGDVAYTLLSTRWLTAIISFIYLILMGLMGGNTLSYLPIYLLQAESSS